MAYPKLVTVAIIEKDGKVLIEKRSKEPFAGFWSFVGGVGYFDKLSDPSEVVKKEVYYDLKVDFTPKYLLGAYFREDPDKKEPFLSLVYVGEFEGGVSLNPKAASEWKLVDKRDLKNIKLSFDQDNIVKDYLSRT